MQDMGESTGKEGAGPDVRHQRYALFRGYLEHEDDLINHRITWSIATQGLLFAAFGILVQNVATLESNAVNAAQQKEDARLTRRLSQDQGTRETSETFRVYPPPTSRKAKLRPPLQTSRTVSTSQNVSDKAQPDADGQAIDVEAHAKGTLSAIPHYRFLQCLIKSIIPTFGILIELFAFFGILAAHRAIAQLTDDWDEDDGARTAKISEKTDLLPRLAGGGAAFSEVLGMSASICPPLLIIVIWGNVLLRMRLPDDCYASVFGWVALGIPFAAPFVIQYIRLSARQRAKARAAA